MQGHGGNYEDQLTQLDADVEHQQRDRNRVLRQSDFGQRTCEAEAVEQAETERDDPGRPRREPGLAAQPVHDLRCDEHDAQRDHRFDRWTGHVHPAQRRRYQRDAVCHGESGDGREDSLAPAHDQQQREHEQQMIDAAEDVFDPEHEVRPGDFRCAGRALAR